MIYSGGLKYILLSALIYLPATLLFWRARKDAGAQVFAKSEAVAVWADRRRRRDRALVRSPPDGSPSDRYQPRAGVAA